MESTKQNEIETALVALVAQVGAQLSFDRAYEPDENGRGFFFYKRDAQDLGVCLTYRVKGATLRAFGKSQRLGK